MITLLSPPGLKSFSGLQMHTPNPPLGLAYIAATLRAAGWPYTVIDGTGEAIDRVHPYPDRGDFLIQGLSLDQIVSRIPADSTVIAVSCMFSTLWPLSRLMAERVRKAFPKALMVLGGEHGTAVPEHVLHSSPFDVVVLGEGEETILALLAAHADGRPWSDVKGIAFLDGGAMVSTGLSPRRRDIDAIPLPDWESFPIGAYIDRNQMNGVNLGRSMPILATRGCPYQCTFCSNPGMWTRRWIPRDPRLVVDEMALYMERYRVTNFNFQDLTAVVKRQWIVDFCNEVIRRRLAITWQMPSGTRAETFDDEVARLLHAAGCRVLAFAPESGSEEQLRAVKKQVDLNQLVQSVRAAIRHGLNLSCFFVLGFPGETKDSLRQSMALIRRLALLGVHDVSVTKFIPYPGSELFLQLQASGKIALDDAFFVSPMDFYSRDAPSYAKEISSRRLYWTMIWMFVNFYVISFISHPWRTALILVKAVFQGREETRYAKWLVDRIYTRRRWKKLQSA